MTGALGPYRERDSADARAGGPPGAVSPRSIATSRCVATEQRHAGRGIARRPARQGPRIQRQAGPPARAARGRVWGFAEKQSRRGLGSLPEDWQRRLRARGARRHPGADAPCSAWWRLPERFEVVQGLPDGQGGVEARTLVGRVVRKGLGDELHGRTFYAVIETPTGDAYHVTVAARVADSLRVGHLVSLDEARAARAIGRSTPPTSRPSAAASTIRWRRRSAGPRIADVRLPPARAPESVGLVAARPPEGDGVPLPTPASRSSRSDTARLLPVGFPLSRCRSGSTRRSATGGRSGSTHWTRRVWRRRGSAPKSSPPRTAAIECCSRLGIALGRHSQRGGKIADLESEGSRRGDGLRQSGQQFLESAATGFSGRLQRGPKAPSTGGVRRGSFVLDHQGRARGQARGQGSSSTGAVTAPDGPGPSAEELADRRESPRRASAGPARRSRASSGWPSLRTVPEGFVGRVLAGPAGSGHLAVSDGARFVLVPATPETLAQLEGRTVEVDGAMPRDASWAFGHGALDCGR